MPAWISEEVAQLGREATRIEHWLRANSGSDARVMETKLQPDQWALLMSLNQLPATLRGRLPGMGSELSLDKVVALSQGLAQCIPGCRPLVQLGLFFIARDLRATMQGISTVAEPAPAVETAVETEARSSEIYRFRVRLVGLQPPIWRELEVPDLTLAEFQTVLQRAFGWPEDAAYSFKIGTDPEIQSTDGNPAELESTLSRFFQGRKRPRIAYVVNLEYPWKHELLLEDRLEPNPRARYPRCTDGARAVPPADTASPREYQRRVQESQEGPSGRKGSKFDPEKFSAQSVNRSLRG